jgi:hypothetical protein
MFDTDVEKTIVYAAIALWFAHGWYLNEKLKLVHEKLDKSLEAMNGLREYLYEIDPQFEDERRSRLAFENAESILSGQNDMELTARKKRNGKRTLDTNFFEK